MIDVLVELLHDKITKRSFVASCNRDLTKGIDERSRLDYTVSLLAHKKFIRSTHPKWATGSAYACTVVADSSPWWPTHDFNFRAEDQQRKEDMQQSLTAKFHTYLKVIIDETGYGGLFADKLADLKSKVPAKGLLDAVDAQRALLEVCYNEYLISRS